MATIKSYTDLDQSKKLARILPLESADMYWWSSGKRYYIEAMDDGDFNEKEGHVRAWSLAALLEQLPYEVCDDDGVSWYLKMDKGDDVYQLIYIKNNYGFTENIHTDMHEHFVDACYELILKLHELNLL